MDRPLTDKELRELISDPKFKSRLKQKRDSTLVLLDATLEAFEHYMTHEPLHRTDLFLTKSCLLKAISAFDKFLEYERLRDEDERGQ
jgi:hypothetical protein